MRRLARPSCWPDDFTSRTTSYRPATCLCSVLGRAQAALVDLVHALLEPLTRVPRRGRAAPQNFGGLFRGRGRGYRNGPSTPCLGAHRDLSPRQGEDLDRNRPRGPGPTLGTAHGGRRSPATRLAGFRGSPPDAVIAS